MAVDTGFAQDFYRLAGFRILGEKAVRIDILERLADLIRPTTSWSPDGSQPKPEGAIDGRNFYVTPAMMSILGATHEDMEVILKGLGYRGEPRLESEVRPVEAKPTAANKSAKPVAEPATTTGPATPDNAPAEAAQETTVETHLTSTEIESGSAPEQTLSNGEASDETSNEPEEPKKILIWRYGGGGRKDNAKRFAKHGNSPKSGHRKPPHKGKSNTRQKPDSKKMRGREVNPDSPFAALAALKESLKSGE